MMKRVARFKDLKASTAGCRQPAARVPAQALRSDRLPAAHEPTTRQTTSPVGADASAMPAIAIAEGFQPRLLQGEAGKGR